MASFLTIIIVAAFVTFPAQGFDMPRIVDVLMRQESGKTEPRAREMIEADFKLCVMDAVNGALQKDLKKLYPDSPCPRCSALCSIKDELAECAHRNMGDTKLERFAVQMIESVGSSFCRPDMMKVCARSETKALLYVTWAICAANMTVAEGPALECVRKASDPEIEGYMCWFFVKSAECVKNIVKVKMPPLYDAVSSIVKDIKYSKPCAEHYQELIDSEGHCKV